MTKKGTTKEKKRKIANDGFTEAKGKKVADAMKEVDFESVSDKALSVSFDAHDITTKAMKFGAVLTGIPLYGYQKLAVYRILYAILTGEGGVITMLFARQSGKSEALAFVVNTVSVLLPALAKMMPDLEHFKDGVRIGLYAPQSDQVWNTYNRALHRLSSANAGEVMGDPDLMVSLEKATKYELTNNSRLLGQVASKMSKIEGATHDLIILEEAQDLDSYIVSKSITPMVAATGGLIIKCGTTGTHKNDFYESIQYNRNLDRKQKDPRLYTHYEFDYKKIIVDRKAQYDLDGKKFHLFYEKFIAEEIRRKGKDSQSFKLGFALEWDLESGMLLTDKDFDEICNNKKVLNKFDVNDIMIAGLDIGKSIASTVLTIGKVVWDPKEDAEDDFYIEVVHWMELSGVDYEIQHHTIVQTLHEYNVSHMYADYTGVGKPVVDRLHAAVGDTVNIEDYTFSTTSKSEMWFNLIDYIQSRRVVIPAHSKVRGTQEFMHFEEQMKNCLKYYEGPYLVCHKADGYLDDYVDSLALMLMATNFEPQEEIEEELFNPMFDSQNNIRNFRNAGDWHNKTPNKNHL